MWLKIIKYQSPKFKLFKDKDGNIKVKKIYQSLKFKRNKNGKIILQESNRHKRWMLKFYHEDFGNETFYFDTKEAMLKFAEQDGIRVEKMFYLADVE